MPPSTSVWDRDPKTHGYTLADLKQFHDVEDHVPVSTNAAFSSHSLPLPTPSKSYVPWCTSIPHCAGLAEVFAKEVKDERETQTELSELKRLISEINELNESLQTRLSEAMRDATDLWTENGWLKSQLAATNDQLALAVEELWSWRTGCFRSSDSVSISALTMTSMYCQLLKRFAPPICLLSRRFETTL